MKSASVLTAEHIFVTYQQQKLVDNISMSLEEGEILGLIGPKRCG